MQSEPTPSPERTAKVAAARAATPPEPKLSERAAEDAEEIRLYAVNTGDLYEDRKSIIRRSIQDPARVNPNGAIRRYREWLERAAGQYQREIERHRFYAAGLQAAAREVFLHDLAEYEIGWNL